MPSSLDDGDVRVTRFRHRGVRGIALSVPLPSPPDRLTEAELEVARLAVEGLDNKSIAARRGTSVRTVANQLASVYRKLGVSSRAELAATWSGH